MPTRSFVILLTLTLLTLPAIPAVGAPTLSVKDLLSVKWIKQVSLSPDGKLAAFTVSKHDYKANKKHSDLYLVSTGATPRIRQLTTHRAGDHSPAFSPNGKQIAFISKRCKDSAAQIYLIALHGGEARKLTSLSTGTSGPLVWSPDGKRIAFSSSVYPDCKGDACNKKKLAAQKKSKVKAQVFDALLIRHWNHWRDARRSHVFVAEVDGKNKGQARDLTPGPHDAPPISLGGSPDYGFSPDSKTLAFVMNTDKVVATSTNNDVFEVPVTGGRPKRISGGKGNDNSPRYSPDGRWLAYLSMRRPGYESDRPRIMVRNRRSGKAVEWTRGYAGHPYELLWARDSKRLLFSAPHKGYMELFAAASSGVRQLSKQAYAKDLNLTPDGKAVVFSHQAADRAPEVNVLRLADGKRRPLTRFNAWLRKQRGLLPAEHHWFAGAGGAKVHAVLIKPPGFRKGGRYPAMVMIHGGPQGMTGDSFHPRWNLQMFAAKGYVVFGINFHGSVGFGQPFSDAIRGDWGGKPYTDILEGTTYLAKLPFVRPKKICAAGASYGGYMINWIAGHTRRFACLISHAGVYNIESKYGSTEELWFPEWDMKGTPWGNRAGYRRWSPHSYAEKMRTPTLVIHGQRDYRVPVEQGFQMFTALQRQGVPSRLLYFPDEDHFVKKPQNIELWWKTMRGWLGRYLR
jgi:dipeptidyl aminopeptidase/acylaminoacyl peptidase